MTAKTQPAILQYQERFGGDMAKLATQHSTVAAAEESPSSVKYRRWFDGEDYHGEPIATSKRSFRPILPTMAHGAIMEATQHNMGLLGGDTHALIASKMPANSKMRKAIKATVLQSIPYFGACKFGEILTAQEDGVSSVLQLFIANFDTDLDTTTPGGFYRPKSRHFDQTFFGVSVLVDSHGKPLGFDTERGDKGIAFKTRNLTQACYAVAQASTGFSMEQLQEMARLASKKAALTR